MHIEKYPYEKFGNNQLRIYYYFPYNPIININVLKITTIPFVTVVLAVVLTITDPTF